jgi:hypothetical protein
LSIFFVCKDLCHKFHAHRGLQERAGLDYESTALTSELLAGRLYQGTRVIMLRTWSKRKTQEVKPLPRRHGLDEEDAKAVHKIGGRLREVLDAAAGLSSEKTSSRS